MPLRKQKITRQCRVALPILPEELIVIICRFISDEDTLRNFCLTSRYYRNLVQPILFEDIVVSGTALQSLIRSLRCRPQRVRSATVHSCLVDGYDALAVCEEAGDESLHDLTVIKHLLNHERADNRIDSLSWTILLEQMLFLLPNLEALSIVSEDFEQILSSDRVVGPLHDFLPCLRELIYVSTAKQGALSVVSNLLKSCPVQQFTAVGMVRLTDGILDDLDLPVFDSVRSLRLRSTILQEWEELRPLISACPHLVDFQYYLGPEECDDTEHGRNLPADTIIAALRPHAKILESLSLSTESDGIDEEFPSMRHFTALKHLRLDTRELAEWDPNDSTADQSEFQEALDSSLKGRKQCKPVLHLLPPSLETLWLDNLYGQEGEFDGNMLRLAEIAKDEFPSLRRVIIEGAEMVESCKLMQNGFEKAGIEFVKKPVCHNWYVEEGLDLLLEDDLSLDGISDTPGWAPDWAPDWATLHALWHDDGEHNYYSD